MDRVSKAHAADIYCRISESFRGDELWLAQAGIANPHPNRIAGRISLLFTRRLIDERLENGSKALI